MNLHTYKVYWLCISTKCSTFTYLRNILTQHTLLYWLWLITRWFTLNKKHSCWKHTYILTSTECHDFSGFLIKKERKELVHRQRGNKSINSILEQFLCVESESRVLLDSAGPILLPRPHFVGQLGVLFIPVDFGICSDLMNPFLNRLSHGSHFEDIFPLFSGPRAWGYYIR